MELPSQFMENWCYHRETLIGLSEHVETKEKLPDKFFEKILAARTFRSASFMLRQLNFGVLDLELHHRYEPDSDETVFDVQRRVADKTTVLPPIPEDRFLCGFSHILTVSPTNQSGDFIFRSREILTHRATCISSPGARWNLCRCWSRFGDGSGRRIPTSWWATLVQCFKWTGMPSADLASGLFCSPCLPHSRC